MVPDCIIKRSFFVTYGQTPLRQHTIIQIEKQKPLTIEIFSTGNLEFRISYYTFAPENERFTRTRKLKSE